MGRVRERRSNLLECPHPRVVPVPPRSEDAMRWVLLLQELEATPVPSPGGDGDSGLIGDAASAAWDRSSVLLKWLAGASLNLLWAGLIIAAIVWVSGKLRRRMRVALERRVSGRNNLPALLDNVVQIGVYI